MKSLFERNMEQADLPFDKVDFIGELGKIIIKDDWKYDNEYRLGLVHPIFSNNAPIGSVHEFRYKVDVEGYGPTYLYVIHDPRKSPNAILTDDVFYLQPFIQDKEFYNNPKAGVEQGTIKFSQKHEAVYIPEDLLKDAYNKIKTRDFED